MIHFSKKKKYHTHKLCRRCGSKSFHVRKKYCSHCKFNLTSKRED